jgi:hypothetical protein
LLGRRFQQDDSELLAADPAEIVPGPQLQRGGGGDPLQDAIAGRMTMRVGDRLEMIGVDHEAAQAPW